MSVANQLDPVAALLMLPIIINEGREALRVRLGRIATNSVTWECGL